MPTQAGPEDLDLQGSLCSESCRRDLDCYQDRPNLEQTEDTQSSSWPIVVKIFVITRLAGWLHDRNEGVTRTTSTAVSKTIPPFTLPRQLNSTRATAQKSDSIGTEHARGLKIVRKRRSDHLHFNQWRGYNPICEERDGPYVAHIFYW